MGANISMRSYLPIRASAGGFRGAAMGWNRPRPGDHSEDVSGGNAALCGDDRSDMGLAFSTAHSEVSIGVLRWITVARRSRSQASLVGWT